MSVTMEGGVWGDFLDLRNIKDGGGGGGGALKSVWNILGQPINLSLNLFHIPTPSLGRELADILKSLVLVQKVFLLYLNSYFL